MKKEGALRKKGSLRETRPALVRFLGRSVQFHFGFSVIFNATLRPSRMSGTDRQEGKDIFSRFCKMKKAERPKAKKEIEKTVVCLEKIMSLQVVDF